MVEILASRITNLLTYVQFSSVAQSCPTLCDPMNRRMPGLPVHHQLLEFTQTHVHWVGDAIQPSHPLLSPSPPAPNPSQHQCFPMSQLFAWGNQSIGASALASVFPKNTQDWSPLEWTGWISLKSKGLSRVFSNTTVQKSTLRRSAFFTVQLSHPYMCYSMSNVSTADLRLTVMILKSQSLGQPHEEPVKNVDTS